MWRKVDRVQVIERSVLARVVIIALKWASVTIGYFHFSATVRVIA